MEGTYKDHRVQQPLTTLGPDSGLRLHFPRAADFPKKDNDPDVKLSVYSWLWEKAQKIEEEKLVLEI